MTFQKWIALYKTACSYEWHDVLLDKWVTKEYFSDLPLTDIHQSIAKKITFGWGFSIFGGILTLLWLFTLFPLFFPIYFSCCLPSWAELGLPPFISPFVWLPLKNKKKQKKATKTTIPNLIPI
jgi:hypothetical protein